MEAIGNFQTVSFLSDKREHIGRVAQISIAFHVIVIYGLDVKATGRRF